ncbi:hypothetical protein INR49_027262 [Caranx melampygus]|nr:hypothetical protein INR49_027262 [Caranx melampygus]
MLHNNMTGRESGQCFPSPALSCPGLPSPPLCSVPQSGSSGMCGHPPQRTAPSTIHERKLMPLHYIALYTKLVHTTER